MKILRVENEDNAVVCVKIIIDLHRSFRQVLEDQVQPFLDIVQEIFQNMETTVKEAFDNPDQVSTPSSIASPRPMSPAADVPDAPSKILPKSMFSFKVLTECPIIVVLLFQSYRRSAAENIMKFVPLIFQTLSLQAKPQMEAAAAAAARGELFIGVSPAIKQKSLYNEFIVAQVKTMSFLAYILRSYTNLLRPYHDQIPEFVLRLLRECPPESSATRKELLVATRHILSTEFRADFVPKIDLLLNESVLIGTGVTAHDTLRPLAYSMLADLVHHIRAELSPIQISRTIYIYSRNLHDPTLAPSIQTMCGKLLLNLIDCIMRIEDKSQGRALLMRILDAFANKFEALNIQFSTCIKQYKKKKQVQDDSTVSLMEKDDPNNMDFDFDRARSIHTGVYIPEAAQDGIKDGRFLFKNLAIGLKPLFIGLRHCNPPPPAGQDVPGYSSFAREFSYEEIQLFVRLFREGLKCFEYYNVDNYGNDGSLPDYSPPEEEKTKDNWTIGAIESCLKLTVQPNGEKEVLDTFPIVFTILEPAVFQELFASQIDFFFERMLINPSLLHLSQFFLLNDITTQGFAGILLKFLVDKIQELGEGDLHYSAVMLYLFRLTFMAVNVFPDFNEAILQPYLANLVMSCFKLAAKAKEPANYFLLLRSLFKSIGGGRFELLYKEVSPLLQAILENLNALISLAHRTEMRNLFVELCLAVPVRLSTLLPYLPFLMRPLVTALQADQDLVSQGLRTMELCNDNLNPEFLDHIMAPVMTELMDALWKHLKPLPYNQQHSHAAMRILGKLGGRNRRMLKSPPKLGFNARIESGVTVEVMFEHDLTPHTLPLDKCLEVAINSLRSHDIEMAYRKHAYNFLKTQLILMLELAEGPDTLVNSLYRRVKEQFIERSDEDTASSSQTTVSGTPASTSAGQSAADPRRTSVDEGNSVVGNTLAVNGMTPKRLAGNGYTKYFSKRAAQEEALRPILVSIMRASTTEELSDDAWSFFLNICRHFILLHIGEAIEARENGRKPFYFLLLRSLFKSIGGGRFELLYKEVSPLLQAILENLNALISLAHRTEMRNLFVELCLAVPVRLSTLLPYLPFLMRPLVTALQADQDLVSQGLRTMELCNDNLNPEFLDHIMAPVMTELMDALWKHLKPLPYNQQHSHAAMRILGKLGGRNRRMLKSPPKLGFNARIESGVTVEVMFEHDLTPHTLPLDKCLEVAINSLRSHDIEMAYRKHAYNFLKTQLILMLELAEGPDTLVNSLYRRVKEQFIERSDEDTASSSQTTVSGTPASTSAGQSAADPRRTSVDEGNSVVGNTLAVNGMTPKRLAGNGYTKYFSKRAAQEEALRPILVSIMRASTTEELSDDAWSFFLNICRHFILLHIGEAIEARENGRKPLANMMDERLSAQHLNTTILVEAIVEAISASEIQLRRRGEEALQACFDVAATVLSSKVDQLPIFRVFASHFCSSCYKPEWYRKRGGCLGISYMTSQLDLGTKWMREHELDFIRSLLFVLKDAAPEMANINTEEATQTLSHVLKVCNGPEDGESAEAQQKFQNLIALLLSELSNSNSVVRETIQSSLQLLADLTGNEVTELLAPVRERLVAPIFAKPLRALPFAMQIGHIDAITYCLTLRPPFLEFNDELTRLLQEALALADAEDQALASRSAQYKNTASLENLRIVCIKLLSAALACSDFSSQRQAHTRARIIQVFFKSLYSKSVEVVETAHRGLQQVLSQHTKLPQELLRQGLRPILTTLSNHKTLSVAGLEGLARLLELLTNYFKVEIGKKLLDHLKQWAEPKVLQEASASIFESHTLPMTTLQIYAHRLSDPDLGISLKVTIANELRDQSLYSKSVEVVETAHRGLQQVLSQHTKLPQELLRQGLRPILTTLSNHKTLSVAGLEGLARLLELLTNYFKVEIGKKLLDHLKQWAEPKVLQEAVGKPVHENHEIKIIVAILNIFHLLPAAAYIFLDELVTVVLEMEGHIRRSVSSPFRPNLVKYLNRYPVETVNYFLEKLDDVRYFQLFVDILNTESASRLRDEVASRTSELVSKTFKHESNSNGTLPYNGVVIVQSLFNYDSNYLTEHDEVLTCIREFWHSQEKILLEQQHKEEDKEIIAIARRLLTMSKMFVSYLRQDLNNIDLIFDLVGLYAQKAVLELSFLQKFFLEDVALKASPAIKRGLLEKFLQMFTDKSVSSYLKIMLIRQVINPAILATFAVKNDDYMQIFDSAIMEQLDQKIWANLTMGSTDDNQYIEDSLCIELLQLTATMVQYAPQLLADRRKEVIKFGWNFLRLEDATIKQAAYVLISHFIAAYETPSKITIQIYVALLRAHSSEARILVKQGLDIIASVLPQRSPIPNNERVPTWVRLTRKVVVEDTHSISQMVNVYQLLIRHSDLFFEYREHFLPQIVNTLPKLGLLQNATPEHKLLTVELAELIIKWEKKRISLQASIEEASTSSSGKRKLESDGASESPTKRMQVENSSGNIEGVASSSMASGRSTTVKNTSEADREYAPSLVLRENVIGYLVRLACGVYNPNDMMQKRLVSRTIELVKSLLSPDLWPDVHIRLNHLERPLMFREVNELIAPSVCSALEILNADIAHRSTEWFIANMTQLHRLLEGSIRTENSRIQNALYPVLIRIMEAIHQYSLSLKASRTSNETSSSDQMPESNDETKAPEAQNVEMFANTEITADDSNMASMDVDQTTAIKTEEIEEPKEKLIEQPPQVIAFMNLINTTIREGLNSMSNLYGVLKLLEAVSSSDGEFLDPYIPAISKMAQLLTKEHTLPPEENEEHHEIDINLLILGLSLMKKRIGYLGDHRLYFLSCLVQLMEKSEDTRLLNNILDMLNEWVMNDANPMPTVKEKAGLLGKMMAVEGKKDPKLIEDFLQLVLKIYSTPSLANSELTIRLEQAFLYGTQPRDSCEIYEDI
ncbi:Putative Transformation/transcription domain-associated protein [Rhizopus microsporus]|nr:Putative Transformation/transcription domain-associated protein [Rhizopus microsporus]